MNIIIRINIPQNFIKIKRNKRFVFDYGYFYSKGKWLTCSELGLGLFNYEECEFNKEINQYIFLRCDKRNKVMKIIMKTDTFFKKEMITLLFLLNCL